MILFLKLFLRKNDIKIKSTKIKLLEDQDLDQKITINLHTDQNKKEIHFQIKVRTQNTLWLKIQRTNTQISRIKYLMSFTKQKNRLYIVSQSLQIKNKGLEVLIKKLLKTLSMRSILLKKNLIKGNLNLVKLITQNQVIRKNMTIPRTILLKENLF